MNKCILLGRLVADPESRTTQSGIAQCTFRMAVQRKFKNAQGERESDFLTVVCWRQTAELCAKYLHKGDRCLVEGSVQVRSYTAQDGQKRSVTEIVADAVDFIRDGQKPATGANAASQTQGQQIGFQQLTDAELEQLPF